MSSRVRLGLWKKATSEKGPMPVSTSVSAKRQVASQVPRTATLRLRLYGQAEHMRLQSSGVNGKEDRLRMPYKSTVGSLTDSRGKHLLLDLIGPGGGRVVVLQLGCGEYAEELDGQP